jgi:penicillin amidase
MPLFLTALLALALLVGGSYYAIFVRPLPRTRGEMQVAGISSEVEIGRDALGVPHVRAESWSDLVFAVGFLHGQDRLWQMDLQRRVAAGRTSEVFGKRTLPLDRLMRRVGLRRVSEAEWHITHATGDIRPLLTAYSEGVNAAMRDRPLPAEFTMLRYRPEPWEPVDCLTVGRLLNFGQAVGWEQQLARTYLLQQLGPELTAALDPGTMSGEPAILGGHSVGAGADGELGSALRAALPLLELSGWNPLGVAAGGSNTWVAHGSHTATGRAILANDPHGDLSMPSSWYQAHLVLPDQEISGLTAAGAPFVVFGHNRDIAWGIANAMVSTQDLYVERFNPNNPLQFQTPQGWTDAVRFREAIKVRGSEPVIEDVTVTLHGPVISPALPGLHPALSLRWVSLDAEIDSIGWAYRLNTARGWKGFRAAVSAIASPALSFTYADAEGNIGYRMSGFIPIRNAGDGRVPTRGWDAGAEWSGFIPLEAMPELFNPPQGVIVAANNVVAGPGFPFRLVSESAGGYRAERIADRLHALAPSSVEDSVDLMGDQVSLPALQLRDLVVDRLGGEDAPGGDVALGLQLLRDWKGELLPDSAAALLIQELLTTLRQDVLGALLPESHRASLLDRPLHIAASNSPYAARLTPVLLRSLQERRVQPLVPPDYEARDALLRRSLADSVSRVRAQHGGDTESWAWGKAHTVRLDHPLALGVPFLGRILSRGPFPVGGDADTIFQTAVIRPGYGTGSTPFYRAVYDVGAWQNSRSTGVPGQSGHPASRHYADLIDAWLQARLAPMAFAGTEPMGKSRVLRLTPMSQTEPPPD